MLSIDPSPFITPSHISTTKGEDIAKVETNETATDTRVPTLSFAPTVNESTFLSSTNFSSLHPADSPSDVTPNPVSTSLADLIVSKPSSVSSLSVPFALPLSLSSSSHSSKPASTAFYGAFYLPLTFYQHIDLRLDIRPIFLRRTLQYDITEQNYSRRRRRHREQQQSTNFRHKMKQGVMPTPNISTATSVAIAIVEAVSSASTSSKHDRLNSSATAAAASNGTSSSSSRCSTQSKACRPTLFASSTSPSSLLSRRFTPRLYISCDDLLGLKMAQLEASSSLSLPHSSLLSSSSPLSTSYPSMLPHTNTDSAQQSIFTSSLMDQTFNSRLVSKRLQLGLSRIVFRTSPSPSPSSSSSSSSSLSSPPTLPTSSVLHLVAHVLRRGKSVAILSNSVRRTRHVDDITNITNNSETCSSLSTAATTYSNTTNTVSTYGPANFYFTSINLFQTRMRTFSNRPLKNGRAQRPIQSSHPSNAEWSIKISFSTSSASMTSESGSATHSSKHKSSAATFPSPLSASSKSSALPTATDGNEPKLFDHSSPIFTLTCLLPSVSSSNSTMNGERMTVPIMSHDSAQIVGEAELHIAYVYRSHPNLHVTRVGMEVANSSMSLPNRTNGSHSSPSPSSSPIYRAVIPSPLSPVTTLNEQVLVGWTYAYPPNTDAFDASSSSSAYRRIPSAFTLMDDKDHGKKSSSFSSSSSSSLSQPDSFQHEYHSNFGCILCQMSPTYLRTFVQLLRHLQASHGTYIRIQGRLRNRMALDLCTNTTSVESNERRELERDYERDYGSSASSSSLASSSSFSDKYIDPHTTVALYEIVLHVRPTTNYLLLPLILATTRVTRHHPLDGQVKASELSEDRSDTSLIRSQIGDTSAILFQQFRRQCDALSASEWLWHVSASTSTSSYGLKSTIDSSLQSQSQCQSVARGLPHAFVVGWRERINDSSLASHTFVPPFPLPTHDLPHVPFVFLGERYGMYGPGRRRHTKMGSVMAKKSSTPTGPLSPRVILPPSSISSPFSPAVCNISGAKSIEPAGTVKDLLAHSTMVKSSAPHQEKALSIVSTVAASSPFSAPSTSAPVVSSSNASDTSAKDAPSSIPIDKVSPLPTVVVSTSSPIVSAASNSLPIGRTRPSNRLQNVPSHNSALYSKQWYHASSGVPLSLSDLAYDSDEQVDEEWYIQQNGELIDEFDDVSESEKALMKIWNEFILRKGGSRTREAIYADYLFPTVCASFARTCAPLIRPRLRSAFLCHLLTCWEFGLLEASHIEAVMRILDETADNVPCYAGEQYASFHAPIRSREYQAMAIVNPKELFRRSRSPRKHIAMDTAASRKEPSSSCHSHLDSALSHKRKASPSSCGDSPNSLHPQPKRLRSSRVRAATSVTKDLSDIKEEEEESRQKRGLRQRRHHAISENEQDNGDEDESHNGGECDSESHTNSDDSLSSNRAKKCHSSNRSRNQHESDNNTHHHRTNRSSMNKKHKGEVDDHIAQTPIDTNEDDDDEVGDDSDNDVGGGGEIPSRPHPRPSSSSSSILSPSSSSVSLTSSKKRSKQQTKRDSLVRNSEGQFSSK